MPIIRKRKIPKEYVDQYLKMGGCSRIGAEVWYIQGKRLQVAKIKKVDPGGDNIIAVGTDGKPVTLSPTDKILFIEPHFKIPKDLKK